MQEWYKIQGYENYLVSSNGVVRNMKFNRTLKGELEKDGYHIVTLTKRGKPKKFKVHRLVILTINKLDLFNTNLQVNHIDGNKLNNNIRNLELVTSYENNHHAYNNDLRPNIKLHSITQYDMNDNYLRDFISVTQAVAWLKQNGHEKAQWNPLVNYKTAYGYKWKTKKCRD